MSLGHIDSGNTPVSGTPSGAPLRVRWEERRSLPASERLVRALEACQDPKLTGLIQRARAGYYDEAHSPLALPIIQLIRDLTAAGYPDLVRRARRGEFDAAGEIAARPKTKAPPAPRRRKKAVTPPDMPRAYGIVPSGQNYQARIYRPGQKELTRYFSASKYGSAEAAFEAAQQWLAENQVPAAPPRPPKPHLPFRTKPQRNNTSGVPGVSFVRTTNRAGERQYAYAVTWMDEEGEKHTNKFYIDDYGSPAAALAEAKQFRKEWEREAWARYQRDLAAWKRGHQRSVPQQTEAS
ncbi:MAG TPA: hypothetical protein VJG32_05030 [Anaerolineae bacterium]|nr:hypothetical protein [Anaerolineae bacterium]